MRERTRFVKSKKTGAWKFAEGAVTSDAAGFKDLVLETEKSIDKFKKDVDFVSKLIDKGKKKVEKELA